VTTCLDKLNYADQAISTIAPILFNEAIAEDTWRVSLACPELALQATPGQFVMVRIEGSDDPLIGRALAVYDRAENEAGQTVGLDLVYLVKGKFTQALSRCTAGRRLRVWGPLGNSFSSEPVDHLVLVAGGVGQTPMLTLGKEALGRSSYGLPIRSNGYAKRVTLCYGARTADRLAGLDDFARAGLELRLATDDGSLGERPMAVTERLMDVIQSRAADESMRIACCGPEPMMEAVAKIAIEARIPCEVSLETPMACGIGICFTCVAKIRQADEHWDYKRTCIEGPIFDAASVVW
jgi:dihydroorotate dehydrogenase electron transfer subunit